MNCESMYKKGKEAILGRMLRNAMLHTGVKQVELLDPLVALLSESLAEEVYRVSEEIDELENRMLESVSRTLCPDITLRAHPAHCVIHALPEEGSLLVTKKTSFFFDDKKAVPPDNRAIKFHPVCNTPIRRGDVRYVVYNEACCCMEANQHKTLLFRAHNRHPLPKGIYWVGVEIDRRIQNVEHLSFFFDFPGVVNKDELLSLLRFSSWKINGEELDIKAGLHVVDMPERDEAVDLFLRLEPTEQLNKAIMDIYDNHFVTLSNSLLLEHESVPYPCEFEDYFSAEQLQQFSTPLLWFEIILPQSITPVLTDSLSVSINVFPVANRYLCSKTQEVNEVIQVIPLETGNLQSFLSIESVIDSTGKFYHELPFSDTQTTLYGTYSLRRGGYERYNIRDAGEYLSRLLGVLSHRSSFAKGIRDEDVDEELSKQVGDLLQQIKKSLDDSKEKYEVKNYILIDQVEEREVFFVSFWLTDCDKANGIKRGACLDCCDGSLFPIVRDSIFTLSETTGGRAEPQFAHRQSLRMKSLSRKDILVTHDDIINYIKNVFGDIVDGVSLRQGVMEDIHSGCFLRTTDIFLIPKQSVKDMLGDKELSRIKRCVESESPAPCYYRIFIDNPQK